MSGKMDPAILAELREDIDGKRCGVSWGLALALVDLLVDRDHHEAEVDRLTRELADCEAHLIGARRDFEAASRVMLERHETELAERIRERVAYRDALDLIAKGHISPSLSFAERVLKGEPPFAALDAEIKAARARR